MTVNQVNPKRFNWVGQLDQWPVQDQNWGQTRLSIFNRYEQWGYSVAAQLYARFAIPGADYNDYTHYASIGLLEAIDRYDPSKGCHFKAYARMRIRGSILSNVVKFAETSHCQAWHKRQLSERLASIRDNLPEELSLEDELVTTILDLAVSALMEQQAVNEQQRFAGSQYDSVEMQALHQRTLDQVKYLEPDQQTIVLAHYQEAKTFTEIAQQMGVSNGRVSQLHSKALKALRLAVLDV